MCISNFSILHKRNKPSKYQLSVSVKTKALQNLINQYNIYSNEQNNEK